MERDGEQRPDARFKAIYVTKLTDATDVAGHSRLPSKELPSDIRVVEKQLLIDFLDPRWNIPAQHRLEKPEGMTWGRKLVDGRRVLIVCYDNDFQRDVESLFLAFAL